MGFTKIGVYLCWDPCVSPPKERLSCSFVSIDSGPAGNIQKTRVEQELPDCPSTPFPYRATYATQKIDDRFKRGRESFAFSRLSGTFLFHVELIWREPLSIKFARSSWRETVVELNSSARPSLRDTLFELRGQTTIAHPKNVVRRREHFEGQE